MAAWRNSAAQPHREAMRRKAEADLIPHLVRLAAAAVEEAKKAAEAAGTLTSLAEAAALQAAHGASSMSVIHEQTTPTEKPASISKPPSKRVKGTATPKGKGKGDKKKSKKKKGGLNRL